MLLLIDDDSEASAALTELLSFYGYAVQHAANGHEALRLSAAIHNRPALILLDLMMPVLDGWGFLAARSKDPLLADVPVVIMSGCRDMAQKAREAGAISFVPKPIEPQTLLRVIERFETRN